MDTPNNANDPSDARREGARVWAALSSQMNEGAGFLSAMWSGWMRFLRRHALGLFLAGLTGAAAGAGWALLQTPPVRAEMTVSYAQMEKKIYADMLQKLDQLRKAGQFGELAAILHLSEDTVRRIRLIDSRNIRQEPLTGDISTEKVPFYVIVGVDDPTILPALQEALVNYLSEPPSVKDRMKLNEQNYLGEIAMLERQMAYLDTLKGMLLKKEQDAGTVTGLTSLHKSQTELFSRLRDLRGALRFNRNIEVLDGFVGHGTPWSDRILTFVLLGFGAGIAAWCVRLVFI